MAILRLLFTGGSGLVEHPGLLDEDAASIWHLDVIHILRRFAGVRLHDMCQGFFGAPSLKPTCLMALNLHGLHKALDTWKLTSVSPSAVSVGKAQDGSFRTSPLKEYPPSMCASLAQAFPQAVELDGQFLQLCASLQIAHRGEFIGADTAGCL